MEGTLIYNKRGNKNNDIERRKAQKLLENNPINKPLTCGNCDESVLTFGLVFVEEYQRFLPCCPHCKANIGDTDIS